MTIRDYSPIIVVEDSDDDYEAVERALKKSGGILNPLIRFENGEDLAAYLNDAGRVVAPALILLDLNMPGAGGGAALKKIKASPDTATIPVIVLTTSEDVSDIRSSYGAGADYYMRKPVKLSSIVAAVQQIRPYCLEFAMPPAAD